MNKQKMLITLAGLATLAAAVVYGAAPHLHDASTVRMLFVESAISATLVDGKLTLVDVSPTTAFFAGEPRRVAGQIATAEIIPLWNEGRASFAKKPVSATLSVFADGKVSNVVLALANPAVEGDQLTYDATLIQGTMPATSDGVTLFIDVDGMPLGPLSVAGVARPNAYRTIVY